MTNEDLYILKDKLLEVKDMPGVRFALMVAKNLRILEAEIAMLNKAQEPTEAFVEYEQKRLELAKRCADRDAAGEPVIEQGQFGPTYKLSERLEEFQAAWKLLGDEYREAIQAREKQFSEFRAVLAEESTVVLVKIPEDDLPESLTGDHMLALLHVVA